MTRSMTTCRDVSEITKEDLAAANVVKRLGWMPSVGDTVWVRLIWTWRDHTFCKGVVLKEIPSRERIFFEVRAGYKIYPYVSAVRILPVIPYE